MSILCDDTWREIILPLDFKSIMSLSRSWYRITYTNLTYSSKRLQCLISEYHEIWYRFFTQYFYTDILLAINGDGWCCSKPDLENDKKWILSSPKTYPFDYFKHTFSVNKSKRKGIKSVLSQAITSLHKCMNDFYGHYS